MAMRDDRYGDGPGRGCSPRWSPLGRWAAAGRGTARRARPRTRWRAGALRGRQRRCSGWPRSCAGRGRPPGGAPVLWADRWRTRTGTARSSRSSRSSLWDGSFKLLRRASWPRRRSRSAANLVEAELYGLRSEQAAAVRVRLPRRSAAGARRPGRRRGRRSSRRRRRTATDSDGANFVRRTAVGCQLAAGRRGGGARRGRGLRAPRRPLPEPGVGALALAEGPGARPAGSPRGGDRARARGGRAGARVGRAHGARAARFGFWASCSSDGTAWPSSRRPSSCSRCRASGSSAHGRSPRSAPSCAAPGAPPTRASRCGARSRSARSLRREGRSRSTCARSSTPPAPGRARRRSAAWSPSPSASCAWPTLAADGQTNRDIAQALYVTPKTVEVHLSNAYRKLDIASRRELPAALTPSTP